MAKSKRLEILTHLCQVLDAIFPDNGYDNDLRNRVYRGRTSISTGGDEDRRAAISILEPKTINPGNFADDLSTFRKDRWVLLIQGWVSAEDNNFEHPTDPAYELAADVERCLSGIVSTGAGGRPNFPGIYLLGKKIAAMELSQPTVRAAEDQHTDRAYFYLPVAFTLASDISQPGGNQR
jgi:hypothetical protein